MTIELKWPLLILLVTVLLDIVFAAIDWTHEIPEVGLIRHIWQRLNITTIALIFMLIGAWIIYYI